MAKSFKFTDYILQKEWADYGFDSRSTLGPVGGTQPRQNDDFPFFPIKSEEIIRELTYLGPLGVYEPRAKPDIIEWGHDVGALKLEFSPAGSSKIFVRKKTKDLTGETVWICKYIFPLTNENKISDKEIPIAHEIYGNLQKLSMEMIDAPQRNYEGFEELTNKLISNLKQSYPSYIMFPVGVKKLNEDYFKIFFEFRGHGQDRMRNRNARSEQFDLDIFNDRKRGLIRIWGYNIDSSVKQHSWKVQPSEFDEWYAPSQPIDEIVDCVSKMFLTY